jgi:glycosyltransferase involved in cell wall biosynthesis
VSTPPPVSICLTTYNRAAVLPKTLESLTTQSFPDWELIISDDCSIDATEEICRSFQKRDLRIKYFRNVTNLKMPGNLNAAILRATGAYIANLHDGDEYSPDLLKKWKAALDAVPSAAFVFNDYEAVDRQGNRKIFNMPFDLRVEGKQIALYYFKTFSSCVWGTVMARKSIYSRSGQFNPRYGFISDVDMWLRLARDHDIAYVNEPLLSLTPREPNHPYAFVHWRLFFWNLGIYVTNLKAYEKRIPEEVAEFLSDYHSHQRRLWLYNFALCLKHRRWDRVKEGLAIWRDADDPWLRAVGTLLGRSQDKPNWYTPSYWELARL